MPQDNGDISAAELLAKLKRNLEMESEEPEIEIPLMEEPIVDDMPILDPEEVIRSRSMEKNNLEMIVDEPQEDYPIIEEPQEDDFDEQESLEAEPETEEPAQDDVSFVMEETEDAGEPTVDDLSFNLEDDSRPNPLSQNEPDLIFDASEDDEETDLYEDIPVDEELDEEVVEEVPEEMANLYGEMLEEVPEEETQSDEEIDAELESILESNTSAQVVEDEFETDEDEDKDEPEQEPLAEDEPQAKAEVEDTTEQTAKEEYVLKVDESDPDYPQSELVFDAPPQEKVEPDYNQQTFFEDARDPIVPDVQDAFEEPEPQDHASTGEITKAVFATNEIDIPQEPTVITEPQDEAFEKAMDDLFGKVDGAPTSATQEFVGDIEEFTDEYETSPTTEQAIDEMMANFLSQNDDAIEEDSTTAEQDAAFAEVFGVGPEGNAEEYINSIEEAIEAEEPKEAVSETEKAIQDMSLDEIDYGEDIDENDVKIMVAFGMEDELAEKLGDENVESIKEALDADASNLDLSRGKKKASTELPDDMEFRSQNQIKDVFKVYKRKQRNVMLRFFGAFIFTIILFIFENFEAFGGRWATFLDPSVFPVVHSMISLQLSFFVLAFAIRDVLSGLGALFSFKPNARSIVGIMTIFTIIYHVGVCFFYQGGAIFYATFPLAIAVLLTIGGEYLTLRRDLYSFNIVSSKRIKYVISEIPSEEESIERDAFAEYVDEDDKISRIAKANFIDGFFKRTKKTDRPVPALRAIIPIPIAVAILFFVFATFVKNDMYLGWVSAYLALMLSTPIAAIISVAAPFTRASKVAYRNDGAIIGDGALDDYGDVAAISFDDKDVFPANGVKIQSIKVFNNSRIDRVIFNVASLYKYIGGPLGDVYNIATKDIECSDDVELVDVQDDGIEAVISGKRIFLGRRGYIIRNGFAPVYDANDRAMEEAGDSVITFLVSNDQVSAKIYTQYTLDATFPAIAKQLYRAGMCMGIKTFDPGIDDDMLSRMIDLSKYPVKTVRCHSKNDTIRSTDKAQSGIVSKKNARSLLKTLSLCDRVNSLIKTNMVVLLISCIIGFVIAGFTLLNSGVSAITGLLVALYQLFWLIPTILISVLGINN